MKNSTFFAVLLLALPVAARAQTKSTTIQTPPKTTTTTTAAGTQQVTEVTEELDPATGKVIRRTTRTTTVPAGTTATPGTAEEAVTTAAATDTQVSDFFREKIKVSTLTAPQLLDTYTRFIDKVRDDRHGWTPTEWSAAAAVLSSLNNRYAQLRPSYSLDDKLTIRGVQGEFQALRTAKQISTSVSDKL